MNVLIANPPWFEKGHSVRAGSRWPHAEFDETEDRSGYAQFPFFMAYAAVLERVSEALFRQYSTSNLEWRATGHRARNHGRNNVRTVVELLRGGGC